MFYRKICNIALILTSIFVFYTWSFTNSVNFPYFENKILVYFLNFVSAFGIFRLVVFIAVNILERIKLVKKIIFGSSYFEGTWVGYYFSPYDNKLVIFYQTIFQTIEDVNIFTRAYNEEDMSYRGIWTSISTVSIKPIESEMSYLFKFVGSTQKDA